jgi:membrane-associated protein TcaA
MKFCKSCGAERKPNQAFCNACGQPFQQSISQEPSAPSKPSPAPTQQRANQPKKPMSKVKKVLIGLLVVFAGILVGGHFYLDSLYSPHKTVEAFEKAIHQQDAKSAKEIINFSAISKDVSKKEVSSYLAYLKDNQKDWSMELRQAAIDAENEDSFSQLIEDQHQNQLLQLIKSGKKWGLYQQYKIEAIPFTLEVSSNLSEVEIDYLGQKESLKKDSLTLNVLPGKEELKSSYDGEYMEIAETTKLDFREAEDNHLEVYLEYDYETVQVYSNEENSTLFVNGKSTGNKIGDGIELGPLPTDGTIVLHAEYKTENEVVKSNEYKVENGWQAYLEFNEFVFEDEPESESVDTSSEASSIEEFMKDYIYLSVNAMNAGDFSMVESYHDPDGKSYQESKDYVDYIASKGIKEDILSVEVIDYRESGDGYFVTTQEEYDIFYTDGTSKRKKFSSTYRLTQDEEGQYQVWSLESTDEI